MTSYQGHTTSLRVISGRGFKPGELTLWRKLKEQLQHLYITSWKGFDPNEVCAMTLAFEGSEEVGVVQTSMTLEVRVVPFQEVKAQEKQIYQIASTFGYDMVIWVCQSGSRVHFQGLLWRCLQWTKWIHADLLNRIPPSKVFKKEVKRKCRHCHALGYRYGVQYHRRVHGAFSPLGQVSSGCLTDHQKDTLFFIGCSCCVRM